MRKISMVTTGVVMLAAVGCGRSDKDAKLSADLRKDLDAASSARVELANSARGYQPTQVVSAIEQPRGAEPVRRTVTKKPLPKPVAATQPEVATSPTPEPEPKVEAPAPVDQTVAESPSPTTVATTPAEEPAVVTRPRPIPISYPGDGGGRGAEGGGVDIGTAIGIIGVVIRGGNGGIDHCDPRTDGRRGRDGTNGHPVPGGGIGGGIMGGAAPRPTFPSRGGSIFRGQR